MPASKKTDENIKEPVEDASQEPRTLDSYSRYKKLNRPMYHRMKYEIRNDPKQKKTYEQWDKLYNQVKF